MATQAERSASTRGALLNATVDCLVEKGYAGTSMPEICRRAGVSRGAQVHHFPTKTTLLVAAMEYVCTSRLIEFQNVATVPEGPDRIRAAFDALFELACSRTLAAWLELSVAARSDIDLQKAMGRLSTRIEEQAEKSMMTMFGRPDAPPRATIRLVLSVLDGLAIRRVLQGDDAARDALQVFRWLVQPWVTA